MSRNVDFLFLSPIKVEKRSSITEPNILDVYNNSTLQLSYYKNNF